MFKYKKEDIEDSPFGCLLNVTYFKKIYENSDDEVIITMSHGNTLGQYVDTNGLIMWIKPLPIYGLYVNNTQLIDSSCVFVRVRTNVNRIERKVEYTVDQIVNVYPIKNIAIIDPSLVKTEPNYMYYLIINPDGKY